MAKEDIRLAILISGGGTTMDKVIRENIEGVNPVVVISSKNDAGGLEKAKAFGITTEVVKKNKDNPKGFAQELLEVLIQYDIDLVSQNGWLPLTPKEVVQKYRVINQHPGPLDHPNENDFGGKGMHGERVTAAVLAYHWITNSKDWWTESSVHEVTADEKYDKGEVIGRRRLDIKRKEFAIDPNDLLSVNLYQNELRQMTSIVQAELLLLEHQNVINVLHILASGQQPIVEKRSHPLIAQENIEALTFAKQIAIQLYSSKKQ